jgi:hypothetical protein
MTTGKTRKGASAAKASQQIVAEGPAAPRPKTSAVERGLAELGLDVRGAMFVEYLTLICVVILGGSAAVVTLGQPLVHLYRVVQLIQGLPIP